MKEERYLVKLSLGLLIVLVLLLLVPYLIPWHCGWHCGPCFWGPWAWKGLWFLVLLVIILIIVSRP